MHRRRFVALTAASAALLVRPARAQVLGPDCGVSFAFGFLQMDPACTLTPLGMTVAPPAHLMALGQAASDTSPSDTPPQSGGRRQRIHARRHRRLVLARSRHHYRRSKGH